MRLAATFAAGLTTPLAGLAAALPVIISTINGLQAGASPGGDRAIIATRAYDVLSTHPPLLGQFSASTYAIGRTVFSPGPLLYWLLAIPVRVASPTALPVVIAVVNALSLMGAVALARRRGGTGLMLLTAVVLALMCRSVSAETLHDILNPAAGLLPFTLLIFLSWSLACGEARLLPLTALVASFAIQSEITYAAPSLLLLAIALLGLLITRAHARNRLSGPRTWPWLLGALLVSAACWAAPAVQEIKANPGNLTLLARAAFTHGSTIGASAGWHAVIRTAGLVPWWLRIPSDPFSRLTDVRHAPPILATISCIVLVSALIALLALACRRRRREDIFGALIALALCAAIGLAAASTPSKPTLITALGYTMWWGSPAGAFTWLLLAWLAFRAAPARNLTARLPTPRLSRKVARLAMPVSLATTLAIGAAASAQTPPEQDRWQYKPLQAVETRVLESLPPEVRTVLVFGSQDPVSYDFGARIILALRRAELHVLAPGASRRLGPFYDPTGPYQATLYISAPTGPVPPGRTIATIHSRGKEPGIVRILQLQRTTKDQR